MRLTRKLTAVVASFTLGVALLGAAPSAAHAWDPPSPGATVSDVTQTTAVVKWTASAPSYMVSVCPAADPQPCPVTFVQPVAGASYAAPKQASWMMKGLKDSTAYRVTVSADVVTEQLAGVTLTKGRTVSEAKFTTLKWDLAAAKVTQETATSATITFNDKLDASTPRTVYVARSWEASVIGARYSDGSPVFNGDHWFVANVAGDQKTYTMSGLTPNTTYWFVVTRGLTRTNELKAVTKKPTLSKPKVTLSGQTLSVVPAVPDGFTPTQQVWVKPDGAGAAIAAGTSSYVAENKAYQTLTKTLKLNAGQSVVVYTTAEVNGLILQSENATAPDTGLTITSVSVTEPPGQTDDVYNYRFEMVRTDPTKCDGVGCNAPNSTLPKAPYDPPQYTCWGRDVVGGYAQLSYWGCGRSEYYFCDFGSSYFGACADKARVEKRKEEGVVNYARRLDLTVKWSFAKAPAAGTKVQVRTNWILCEATYPATSCKSTPLSYDRRTPSEPKVDWELTATSIAPGATTASLSSPKWNLTCKGKSCSAKPVASGKKAKPLSSPALSKSSVSFTSLKVKTTKGTQISVAYNAGGPFRYDGKATSSSYTVKNLKPSTQYWIRAIKVEGVETSSPAKVLPLKTKSSTPTIVKKSGAKYVTPSSTTLAWKWPSGLSGNGRTAAVYISEKSNGPYRYVATVTSGKAKETKYVLKGLAANKVYYARVQDMSGQGTQIRLSAASKVQPLAVPVAAKWPAFAVADQVSFPVDDNRVKVTVQKPPLCTESILLYYAEASSGPYTFLADLGTSKTKFTKDVGLPRGGQFSFGVACGVRELDGSTKHSYPVTAVAGALIK